MAISWIPFAWFKARELNSSPKRGIIFRLRPVSYGPLRHQPLTCKGEVAHEADGTTVGCDPQPRPNLFSPECPAHGLPQGGKPTNQSGLPSNSDSAPRRRKAKRVSESKLHGAVNSNLVALLTTRERKLAGGGTREAWSTERSRADSSLKPPFQRPPVFVEKQDSGFLRGVSSTSP